MSACSASFLFPSLSLTFSSHCWANPLAASKCIVVVVAAVVAFVAVDVVVVVASTGMRRVLQLLLTTNWLLEIRQRARQPTYAAAEQ